MKKLTGSKDLISTSFAVTLLNFLWKLVIYIFMLHIDNLVKMKIKQIQDLLFETKTSYETCVLVKKIGPISYTNSLEQCLLMDLEFAEFT